ncbi:PREDICTED: uncharacterized protein LOC106103652 [Papilio polytes]|uniref:uncharacterized protein LOC106103652 n=1 Tax=Papilio polytes TaxID=76194 RepID=UPI000675D6DD|nr:PREDICTED: uncharacterized protein LOC106103652 [Papilio polytes]
MYIAFKWLLGLTFTMWLFACTIDIYFISLKENNYLGTNVKDFAKSCKNLSAPSKEPKMDLNINIQKHKKSWFGLYHYYAILCVVGFIISAVNKRKKLILLASLRKDYFKTSFLSTLINTDYLKRTANETYCTISNHVLEMRSDLERAIQNWQGYRYFQKPLSDDNATKEVLLKKLKDLREEKKNLSLLLAAAICENRNIVVGYRLDSGTKNQLILQTKDNDRKRKDCQSQYLNFQQLYTLTHQENIYLHSQVKHLTKMKEVAERNLLNLVHEIWLSKNEKLIAFCSRFVVQTKDKILSSDIRAEINKFLQSSSLNENERFGRSDRTTKIDDNCKSLELKKNLTISTSEPKLVGLPGEHIWTVKDRDGFIEKLYEYDFESNGNTIRRIREYSVYHDKDCFFENFSSRTIIKDDGYSSGASRCKAKLNCNRIQNQRFLTGSQAFQLFLQNTQNFIIPVKTFYGPSISYG